MFEQEFNLWGLIPGLQCMTLYVIYIDCVSYELYKLPLLSLSHLVPLGVKVKERRKNRVDAVGGCGFGLLTRERFWAKNKNCILEYFSLFYKNIFLIFTFC